MRRAAGALFLLLALPALAAPKVPDSVLARIRPDGLQAHVQTLAADGMEGRRTGTPGFDRAAAYVVAQMEAAGLEPGADGQWQQPVPVVSSRAVPDRSRVEIVRDDGVEPLAWGTDVVVIADPGRAADDVDAALVFVGYGISAPAVGLDDYAGVDVRDKVAVMIPSAPEDLDPETRARYGSLAAKARAAAEHGAAGVVVLTIARDDGKSWRARRARAEAGEIGFAEDPFAPGRDGVRLRALLSRDASARLLAGAPHSLDEVAAAASASRPRNFDLPGRLRAHVETSHEDVRTANVVGILRGRDPALARETVVLSAHLDHLGIGEAVNGDAIYNGAYDNASGVAGLLEIARAFTALQPRPARTVAFVATTGEEQGLLGSSWFATHPTVPPDGIVADVNLDMITMLFPLDSVMAIGAEHSTLSRAVGAATRRLHLEATGDALSDQHVLVRSDQYPFLRRGVPSLILLAGFHGRHGVDRGRAFRDWLGHVYHTPADDLSQAFDWESGARLARAGFLIAEEVASSRERPRFNAGDPLSQGR